MKTSIQILPGIKFIGWIDCRHLPRRVDLSAICRVAVPVLTDIHPIDFFGEPECQCLTKKQGAGFQQTATLKFLSYSEIPLNSFIGFVVTDVNDNSYLIGSREHPRPVMELNRRTGTTSGESAAFYYEVKHVALRTLVQCAG